MRLEEGRLLEEFCGRIIMHAFVVNDIPTWSILTCKLMLLRGCFVLALCDSGGCTKTANDQRGREGRMDGLNGFK